MELSERIIQTLENEGFTSVYEVSEVIGTVHKERISAGTMSIVVTDGSIEYAFAGNAGTLRTGNRLDIPACIPYYITAGPAGCNYVVGEKLIKSI